MDYLGAEVQRILSGPSGYLNFYKYYHQILAILKNKSKFQANLEFSAWFQDTVI